MPGNDPLQAQDDHRTPAEQFKADRLDREGIDSSKYPSQVDRAAIDILRGIAVGETDDLTDFGGTIDKFNFDEATGEFYVEGLKQLTGQDSALVDTLAGYNPNQIGQLAYQLNALRHTLRETGDGMDIDRALESLIEKTAATAIEQSVKSGGNEGAGLRSLRNTDSVSELVARLFSDPRVDAYSQALVDQLPSSDVSSDGLIEQLDDARMTTPLWEHQREALEQWQQTGQQGYVDMATATGKTVLGLAAIALRYGALHPIDHEQSELLAANDRRSPSDVRPRVLIVAGTDILLSQWRSEFDTHLDIPKGRTAPAGEDNHVIELDWGDIEFRTAQDLLSVAEFSRYDLVILDEAHRYSRGRSSGRGWADLFEDLTTDTNAILAMSGSVDSGWAGDSEAKDALEKHLELCYQFDVAKAKQQGVIADFSWKVQYLPARGDVVDRLASQTRITTGNYDSKQGIVDTKKLGIADDAIPAEFVDYDDLRSFVQSNAGDDLRAESPQFDAFASALLARKPLRWNTTPDSTPIAGLVADHAPEQKTVVLVRSYNAADQLATTLHEEFGVDTEDIVAFTDSSENRYENIEEFNEQTGGVIIGPGDLLGTGVDLPDAEVAVNVSRGGVNPSLVQRIGRVLRNPTGEKEATFYHLVAQPVDTDAIDLVEDGATLLTQAAEFRALGDTFRELPAYSAHEDIEEQIILLERNGVALLERVDDESKLVSTSSAHEHLRTLQALVYDAETDSKSRETTSVLASWKPADSEGPADQQYPERNDAYEQYRLALGPYRAAKAIATNIYETDLDITENDGRLTVSFDEPELHETAYHEAVERWLNEYRQWRADCDNKDGSGESGSLPQYKSEWPEPPANNGVMLSKEVVSQIGVSYADADPIFFPYEDDSPYALPLPDGQFLTIEGIVDDPEQITTDSSPKTDSKATTDSPSDTESKYTADGLLIRAIEEQADERDNYISEAIGDLLKDSIDGSIEVPEWSLDGPRTNVGDVLSDRNAELLRTLAEEESTSATDVESLIDAALLRRLHIDGEESVKINPVLFQALESTVEGQSVADFVNDLLLEEFEKRTESHY